MKTSALAFTCAGLLLAGLAQAQQTPLTGQMLDTPARPAPAATAAISTPALSVPAAPLPTPSPTVERSSSNRDIDTGYRPTPAIGDATRALVSLQASGQQAGPALPIPGDQAKRSYARYLQSFEHPIPEQFEARVSQDVRSGSGN